MMLLLVALLAQTVNPVLTPGAIRPLTTQQVCSIEWGLDRRHVTASMKAQVERAYSVTVVVASGKGPCCEIDHRIPRELGGADDVKNLWPQPWADAHVKDLEENQYHKDVCSGTITLQAAQDYFRHWGQK